MKSVLSSAQRHRLFITANTGVGTAIGWKAHGRPSVLSCGRAGKRGVEHRQVVPEGRTGEAGLGPRTLEGFEGSCVLKDV